MGSVSRIYFSNARSLRELYGRPLPSTGSASGRAPEVDRGRFIVSGSVYVDRRKEVRPAEKPLPKKQPAAPAFTETDALRRAEANWRDWTALWTRGSRGALADTLTASSFFSADARQVAVLLPCASDQVTLTDARDLLRLLDGLRGTDLKWSVSLVCADGECLALPSTESRAVDRRLAELRRRGHDEEEVALLLAAEYPTKLNSRLSDALPWPKPTATAEVPVGVVEPIADKASLELVIAQGHEFLRRGKSMNAVRLCQRHGLVVGALGEALDEWMERSYARGSYGELLSFVRAAGMYGPYSAVELLTLAAERGYEANFLKQAHALGIYAPLRESIDAAVNRREAKGTTDVDAWRRKFQEIAEAEEAKRVADEAKVYTPPWPTPRSSRR